MCITCSAVCILIQYSNRVRLVDGLSPVPRTIKPAWSRHTEHTRVDQSNIESSMASPIPPRNFSWLEEGKLAGLAYPSLRSELEYLINQGIKNIITLTESPLSTTIDINSFAGVKFTHIPVVDLTPPTLDQIKEFLKTVEQAHNKGEAVAVHCQYGQGRVGTMLACYLVERKGLSGKDAIIAVRTKRPGSIETTEQEKVIVKFAEYLKQSE